MPLDPGIPWGPIRLKWHGRYLQPEAASLIFGAGLLLTLLAAFGCWRLVQVLSRPAPAPHLAPIVDRFPPPQPHRSPRRSRTKGTPAPEAAGDMGGLVLAPPSGKPSAAVQAQPQPAGEPQPSAAPPVFANFRASSPDIERGETTTLRWAIAGEVTSVAIAPGFDELPSRGEIEVRPERTTQYTLSATGPGGTVPQSLVVRVEASRAQ